jgi:F-type H+-transporting ATPase subunit delta
MAATEESRDRHEPTDVGAQRIGRVYAESLYAAAQKRGQVDEVLGELQSLVKDVFDQDERLEIFLSSAAVGRDVRAAAIEKVFKPNSSQTFYSFLQVVNAHERLELLRSIAHAYRDLVDERARRVRVQVTSATPLGDDQMKQLQDWLRERMELEPIMVQAIDPDLLGGMKVRVRDLQYDGSVKTRIEQIRHQILERSSHEIQSRRDHFRS